MRTTISTTTTSRHNKRVGTRIPVHIHLIFKNTHSHKICKPLSVEYVYIKKQQFCHSSKILRGEVRWWK